MFVREKAWLRFSFCIMFTQAREVRLVIILILAPIVNRRIRHALKFEAFTLQSKQPFGMTLNLFRSHCVREKKKKEKKKTYYVCLCSDDDDDEKKEKTTNGWSCDEPNKNDFFRRRNGFSHYSWVDVGIEVKPREQMKEIWQLLSAPKNNNNNNNKSLEWVYVWRRIVLCVCVRA